MRDREDRIVGLLVGLAAGDRNGGPIRMALRVAESLRDRGDVEVADIARRYLEWWRQGAFDTGPTFARVLTLVASGMPFDQASIRADAEAGGMRAGCNPAHRVAPLAMCAAIEDARLTPSAIAEALLTHRHPLSGDVAAAVVVLCRALIRGMPWPDALAVTAQDRHPEVRRALRVLPAEMISADGYAPHVLAAAVHFVGTSDSLSSALARSIRFAGPENYCPVLVGSIGGARWGRSQLDEASLGHCRDLLPRLDAVAAALASRWPMAELPAVGVT